MAQQLALFGGPMAPREQDDAKRDGGAVMTIPTALRATVDTAGRGGHDPMLPVGTARCKCSGCDRYFSSVGSFDKHRREGRCLTEAEMLARGMLVNARGYWVSSEFTRDVS